MQDGKISKIVIVGGGSSGWMSAAYLSKAFKDVKIVLVESSDIPTIGVGEATIATIAGYLSYLGLKERDWMPACNASYKYSIRFNNWHEIGDEYWHPFDALPYFDPQLHLGQFWYHRYLAQGNTDRTSLYRDCFLSVDFCKQNKILKKKKSQDFLDTYTLTVGSEKVPLRIPYAYHFDAGLFGEFLKNHVAKPNGVEQIIDEVTETRLTENGFIDHIETKSGRKIHGDLFIDCSGFRALLISKVLKEPFNDYSDTLFCDKAIAMRVPYQDIEKELKPYTSATAMSSGWIWNIPLTERIGTGYVYSSAALSGDQAEKEFRSHWDEGRVKDLDVLHIDIRVGKHTRTWVRNCVAIGLSSGFIEPLESTGLHFVFAGIGKLVEAISSRIFNAPIVAAYNRYITMMMDEARDFLALHYALTNREDTAFWKRVKYDTKLSDSLSDYLVKCKMAFPNRQNNILFVESSWVCILNGMNYLPGFTQYSGISPQLAAQQYQYMEAIQTLKRKISDEAPMHHKYLQSLAISN
jgi:tryptophan halogenase